MTTLNPKICGKWDGNSLWLQWNLAEEGVEFDLEIHYRRDDQSEWTPWITTVPPQGARSHWGVIPTWKEGWIAQARLKRRGAPPRDWELAAEVTFLKCSAKFEITSEKYEQYIAAGTIFHSQVHGAACAYQCREEIYLKEGDRVVLTMFAMGSSGYFQLDRKNDFDIKPNLGVRIRNLAESIEDIEDTGRDFTVIEAKPPDPVTMTVRPQTHF